MQRYQERFSYPRTLLDKMGVYATIRVHEAAPAEPYDLYVYVVMENRVTKAQWKEVDSGFFPLVPDTFEGPAGHCFKQTVIDGDTSSPCVYFGTIEQPCTDMSVVVGMDPDNLPTVYTTQLPNPEAPENDWEVVEYPLTCDGDNFTWDGGAATTIPLHNVGACAGATTGGIVYVIHDGPACFAADEYGTINLEAYVLED